MSEFNGLSITLVRAKVINHYAKESTVGFFWDSLLMSLPEGNGERISQIRVQMAIELKEGYGLTLAEEGGQPGVSTSATSRILMINSVKNN